MARNSSIKHRSSEGKEAPHAEHPTISVVTVSLDNRIGLETTIKSILEQTYGNIEYIVIDGGSGDGSLEVLEKNSDNFACWISEPDEGIYDAMNKGVASSTGDWVIFMNAGDVFYSNNTVENIFSKIDRAEDLIYGDCIFRYVECGNLRLYRKSGHPSRLWKGMAFSHQAVFIRGRLLREEPFDLSYKYGADYDMIYKMYVRRCRIEKIDEIVAIVSSGGESHVNRIATRIEQIKISRKYSRSFFYDLYFLMLLLGIQTVRINNFLPQSMLCGLYRMRYKFRRIRDESKLS